MAGRKRDDPIAALRREADREVALIEGVYTKLNEVLQAQQEYETKRLAYAKQLTSLQERRVALLEHADFPEPEALVATYGPPSRQPDRSPPTGRRARPTPAQTPNGAPAIAPSVETGS